MDQRSESIRQEIDETRESMTEKLEHIESTVRDAGDNVKHSMQESVDRTVDNVKGSVGDTIDQVKTKLNLQQIVSERPWTVLGASVLAGYMLGNLNNGSRSDDNYYNDDEGRRYDERQRQAEAYRRRYRSDHSEHAAYADEDKPFPVQQHLAIPDYPQTYDQYSPPSSGHRPPPRAVQKSQGLLSDVADQFSDEIEVMKDATMAAITRMLRETLQENIPQLAEEYDRARRERMQEHNQRSARHEHDGAETEGAHESVHRLHKADENVEPTSQADPAAVENRR